MSTWCQSTRSANTWRRGRGSRASPPNKDPHSADVRTSCDGRPRHPGIAADSGRRSRQPTVDTTRPPKNGRCGQRGRPRGHGARLIASVVHAPIWSRSPSSSLTGRPGSIGREAPRINVPFVEPRSMTSYPPSEQRRSRRCRCDTAGSANGPERSTSGRSSRAGLLRPTRTSSSSNAITVGRRPWGGSTPSGGGRWSSVSTSTTSSHVVRGTETTDGWPTRWPQPSQKRSLAVDDSPHAGHAVDFPSSSPADKPFVRHDSSVPRSELALDITRPIEGARSSSIGCRAPSRLRGRPNPSAAPCP